jgi:predicted ATPase/DNA-binding SARP family transcriptional activator
MDVRIGVLGPLLVERAEDEVRLERAAWRRLLLVLAVHRGELVQDTALLEACWPEASPANARATLRTYVSHLRQRLGAEVIRRDGPGYRLVLPPERLDGARFEALLRDGRTFLRDGAAAAARDVLEDALSLWRGPALVEVADEPFARLEAGRLDGLRIAAREDLLEARLAASDSADLSADARALAEAHPERERGWQLLLRALAAAGRQQEASALYRGVRDRLVEEVGTEPGPALQEEHRRLLRQEPAHAPEERTSTPSQEQLGTTVPRPSDRFVGRTAPLGLIERTLADHRLVTLLGPGGSGKTRLAVEAVARRSGRAWFVDLAAATDGAQVIEAVRAAVGATPRAGLSALEATKLALADGEQLVILDNCEHLVGAAATTAAALLEAASQLRILATSRTPLDVAGEQRIPVPPLALPPEDELAVHTTAVVTEARDRVPVEAGGETEAVQLFVERARGVDPAFAPTGGDLRTVARVCRRLDGMPLAIELAAARIAHLSLDDLAARLDDRFGVLTRRRGDQRHRTLRAAVDWSHQLLEPAEQALFRRLAVFVGTFTLDAASAIHGEDAWEPLTALVDQSMVVVEPAGDGVRRYRLLETLRAYASEHLEAAGEEVLARERHVEVVSSWAAGFVPTLGWPDPGQMAEARAERGNFRAAVHWALGQGRHELVVQLVSDTVLVWETTGWLDEPRDWLETAFAAALPSDDRLRLRALQAIAWLAGAQSDYERAAEAAGAAAELASALGERLWRARALDVRANAAWNTGDWDLALELYHEMLPLFRAAGDVQEEVSALQCIAAVAYRRGDYDRAAALLAEAVAVHRRAALDHPDWWRYDAGILANRLGDYRTAEAHLTTTLRQSERWGEDASIGASLRDLALLATNEGRFGDGVEMATDSLRRHRRVGDRWGEAATLQVLARAHLLRGAPTEAVRAAQESLEGFLRLGDDWGAAGSGILLGRATSDPADARRVLDSAQRRAHAIGDPWLVAESLDAVADRLPPDEAASAAAAAGEADAIRAAIGAPLPPSEQPAHEARHRRLEAALGREAYERALTIGRGRR